MNLSGVCSSMQSEGEKTTARGPQRIVNDNGLVYDGGGGDKNYEQESREL